jgi:mRNA-degrading endonuclease toxin of MazEF toxin-antitoxin module
MLVVKNMNKFQFGEVWLTDLNPTIGHEQGMTRSVVIVSSNNYNRIHKDMRLIVPISTSEKYCQSPFWVNNPWIIPTPENDFGTGGVMLLDQLRTIDISKRAKRQFGTFDPKELADVSIALKSSIG